MVRLLRLAVAALVLTAALGFARPAAAAWPPTVIATTPNGKAQLWACKDGPYSTGYGSLWKLYFWGINHFQYNVRMYIHIQRPGVYGDVGYQTFVAGANTTTLPSPMWASRTLNDAVLGTVTDPAVFYTGPRLSINTQIAQC